MAFSFAGRTPCDGAVVGHAPAGTSCRPADARWILAATILGSSLAFVDGTVVNVALPVLQQELGASVAEAQWIVEAYALFLSALVLVGGALADRYGRRRIFSFGTVIFVAASIACGLAPGIAAIVAARAVQGIGAALLVPASLAILGAAFPPGERGRAVGAWSAGTAVTTAIGPALGGWIAQALSWRAVFYLNVPLAAAVLLIARFRVPESHGPAKRPLDVAGAIAASVGLAGVVFGLIEAPRAGWSAPRTWAPLSAGAAALAAFAAIEARGPHPMAPPALFRIRNFAAANLLTLFLYAALSAVFFFLPFDLIQARGYSPAAAGAAILPLVVLMVALSRWTGRLADALGPRLPLTVGPAVAGAGFLLLAALAGGGSYAASVLPGLAVLGLGVAVTVAPLTAAVLNAVDRSDAGVASGINNAVARVAGLLAIAVFGIVATGAFGSTLDRRLDAAPGVSAESRRFLDAERGKLGAMAVPPGAGEGEARTIRRALRDALGAAFRGVAAWSGGLALLAAACGAIGVRSPRRRRATG